MFNHRTHSLIAVCALTLVVLIVYTAPFATLAAVAGGVHAGPAGRTWMLSSTSLGLAAALLAVGALADTFGHARVVVAGAVTVAAASVVCAVAGDAAVFVLGRVAQGLGSAAVLAAGLGLLGTIFPSGPERARATGLWAAMLGLGIAIGPVATAGLTALAGWRSPYLLDGALASGLAVWSARRLPAADRTVPRRPDLAGTALLGTGIALLVAALVQGRTGWVAPAPLGLVIGAGILLAAFVVVERRTADPMLDLRLLAGPRFFGATAGGLFTGMSVIALMSFLPTPLGAVFGLSPTRAAGVIAIWSGLSFAVALGAGPVARRIGHHRQLVAALGVTGAGLLAMSGTGADWIRFVPGLLLAGLGTGLLNAALAGLAVDAVPAGRAGMGSGAVTTARYVGAALGVALVSGLADGSGGSRIAHGTGVAVVVTGLIALTGAVVTGAALALDRLRIGLPAPDPDEAGVAADPVEAEFSAAFGDRL